MNPLPKLLGPSWAPKAFGLLALLAQVIANSPSLLAHAIPAAAIPSVVAWANIITALAAAGFIGTVKGHNVTGGTVAATPEAVARVTPAASVSTPTSGPTSGAALGAIMLPLAASLALIGLGGCAAIAAPPTPAEVQTESEVTAAITKWLPAGNTLVRAAISGGLALTPSADRTAVGNAIYEAGQGLYQQMNSATPVNSTTIAAAIKAENPTDLIVGMVASSVGTIWNLAATQIPSLALYSSAQTQLASALGNDLMTAAAAYAPVTTPTQ